MAFKDEMTISIDHGNKFVVPVRAIGTGTCVIPSIDVKNVHFGDRFTSHRFTQEFSIENRGRKMQVVSWGADPKRGATKAVSTGALLVQLRLLTWLCEELPLSF
jgi:hypothetical protein